MKVIEALTRSGVNCAAVISVMRAMDDHNLDEADAIVALTAALGSIIHARPADQRRAIIDKVARVLARMSALSEGETHGQ